MKGDIAPKARHTMPSPIRATIEPYENSADANSGHVSVVLIVLKMRGPLTRTLIEDLFLHEGGSAHNGILPLYRRSVEVDDDQEFVGLTRPGMDTERPLVPRFIGLAADEGNHFL